MEKLAALLTLCEETPPDIGEFPSLWQRASNADRLIFLQCYPAQSEEQKLGWTVVWDGMPLYDDVIKWEHFPRCWPFVRGIRRSPLNSSHKGQWRGAWMFSLICPWINGWVNNREAGDLRRNRAHHNVTVMNFGRAYQMPSSLWPPHLCAWGLSRRPQVETCALPPPGLWLTVHSLSLLRARDRKRGSGPGSQSRFLDDWQR